MKNTTTKEKKNTKVNNKIIDESIKDEKRERRNKPLTIFSIFALGLLLIMSTYAWFSTSLNVQVKTFNMVVTRNSGLTISLDAINYDSKIIVEEMELLGGQKREQAPAPEPEYRPTGDYRPMDAHGDLPF